MSKKIYLRLTQHYDVNLACSNCWKEKNGIWVLNSTATHKCEREKILIRPREIKESWVEVRSVPDHYIPSEEICEQLEATQKCSEKCKSAHSVHELFLWNLIKEFKWSFEVLLHDLTTTTLMIRCILTNAFECGNVIEACKECYNAKNYTNMAKLNKHTPLCKKNHPWKNTKILFETKKENSAFYDFESISHHIFDENQEVQKIVNELSSMLQKGFSEVDILQESRKATQIENQIVKGIQSNQPYRGTIRHSGLRNTHAIQKPDHENYFDDELESLRVRGDIDVPKELPFYGANCNDEIAEGDGHNLVAYYKRLSVTDCKRKTKENPNRFKECKILLNGTQRAKCVPLDNSDDIEIHGRHNCGQAFDGDLVIVEIMDINQLETMETIRRGRVLCVTYETTSRQIYNFVCVVDDYHSHLMRPICGKAPKLHVEHRPLNDLPEVIKNSRVCVYENNGGHLDHVRTVQIQRKQENKQLFVVRYEKWDPRFMYPYGYVVKVIRPGIDLESGQNVLDLVYQLPPRVCDIDTDNLHDVIPSHLRENRRDFTNLYVFSIDPASSKDIDDALSIEKLTNNTCQGNTLAKMIYRVGIHIADVNAFIQKGDEIDMEAYKRRMSFYPVHGEPVHMLPEKLSTNLCSLIENEDRLCISLMVEIDETGNILDTRENFTRSIIRNKNQMTYRNAQDIIEQRLENMTENDKKIKEIYLLAVELRRNRLGDALYKRDHAIFPDYDTSEADARLLVEELMILANKQAAIFVKEKFPKCYIVRAQAEPQKDKLKRFVDKQKDIAYVSSVFDQMSHSIGIVHDRVDMRSVNVFSIATSIFGCGFSVKKSTLKDSKKRSRTYTVVEVGIHFPDTTAIIKGEKTIDRNAFEQRIKFYPVEGEHLSTTEEKKFLQLPLGIDTPCLSIFVKFREDEDGFVQERNETFLKTVLNNSKQFSRDEVLRIIRKRSETQDIEENILILQSLAKGICEKRLNHLHKGKEKDRNAHEQKFQRDEATGSVREFIILANELSMHFLEKHCPEIKQRISKHIQSQDSVCLPRICREHIFYPLEDQFVLLDTVFEQMKSAYYQHDMQELEKLAFSEELHPSLAILFNAWYEIQKSAELIVGNRKAETRHLHLQTDCYTWFTSPIRRYADVVVHRFIIAALHGENINPPYDEKELKQFCDQFNNTFRRQQDYNMKGKQLKAAVFMQKTPVFMPSIVSSHSEEGLELLFPFTPNIPKSIRALTFKSLGVHRKPTLNRYSEDVSVQWSRRIYDVEPNDEFRRTKEKCTPGFVSHLNGAAHSVKVPKLLWMQFRKAVSRKDKMAVMRLVESLITDAEIASAHRKQPLDVTSEMTLDEKLLTHHTTFMMNFRNSQVIQCQLGAVSHKGMLEPQIKLLGLTQTIAFCIEHVENPIVCFADIATRKRCQKYSSLQQYRETWLPMLAMEAACVSVQNGDPVLINNVAVTLQRTNNVYHGFFELDPEFCEYRFIQLISKTNDKTQEGYCLDYLCLKFQTQNSAEDMEKHMDLRTDAARELKQFIKWKNSWVAHAIGEKAMRTEEAKVRVPFIVNHCYGNVPSQISQAIKNEKKVLCNIEFIIKNLPHKRMQNAVESIAQVGELCRDIVLGRSFPIAVKTVEGNVPNRLDIVLKPGTTLNNNSMQERAIKMALTQPFTVVQGPPGTGKTLTGVKIAYWFNFINKANETNDEKKKQIMYCGPSNSAVDVAMKLMAKKLGAKCPKMLRIYGETLESQIFKIPRDVSSESAASSARQYRLTQQPEEMQYGLHHRIRGDNSYSGKITALDKWFERNKKTPEKVSDDDIQNYKNFITYAAMEEIKKYDIIFCTCAVSSSPRVTRAANITQLIIDECGMCMEPESLIPLISFQPNQVVLIGDHKQLRPIVQNSVAKDLELEISLFERHARLQGDATIMLEEQYRMHPGICEFPSNKFYEGKLKTIRSKKWTTDRMKKPIWPNAVYPIVFCHVEGAEKALPVATDKGNEHSKSNELERDEVIEIFTDLINLHNIGEKDITVLSQYKAQCNDIQEHLKERGFENASVLTVVASQGDEQDYIILSTVRSLPMYEIDKNPSDGWMKKNLGFITDEHQINVALTRARKGLIIVGNKNLLRCNPMWRELLQYYEELFAVVDSGTFPYRKRSPWKPHDPARNQRGLEAHLRDRRQGFNTKQK